MSQINSTSNHSPSPVQRRALAIASLAIAGLAITYAVTRVTAAPPAVVAAPPAPRVTVAPVEEKLLTEYQDLTGRVDSLETVELRARVSGHLESVRFRAGQLVQKGDVLVTIDPRWYRAQFDLTHAQVAQARAHADVAEREAHRAAEMLAVSAISSEEAEARHSRALEARSALAAAEATAATARLDLENTEVRAPIAGRVSRALLTAGNLVSGAPGSATLLTTIVSVGEAFVYADLDEATVLKFNRLARENRLVPENNRVPVALELGDETGYPRHGYIESTDNRLNPGTGSLVLRMVFPNPDGALLPGLFARVRVPVSAPQQTLLISERSIGTDQSQKFVLTVDNKNTVVYRSVKLGGSVDGKRIVRDGLHAGDQIVINGLQRVRPGMTVSPEFAVTAVSPTTSPASTATLASR